MLVTVVAGVIIVLLAYSVVRAVSERRDGESADRTAERAGEHLQGVTAGLLSVGRVSLLVGAGLVVTFFQEGAALFAESPLVAVELGTIGLGWLALEGGLPLTANQFAIGALALAIVGVVWRNA